MLAFKCREGDIEAVAVEDVSGIFTMNDEVILETRDGREFTPCEPIYDILLRLRKLISIHTTTGKKVVVLADDIGCVMEKDGETYVYNRDGDGYITNETMNSFLERLSLCAF